MGEFKNAQDPVDVSAINNVYLVKVFHPETKYPLSDFAGKKLTTSPDFEDSIDPVQALIEVAKQTDDHIGNENGYSLFVAPNNKSLLSEVLLSAGTGSIYVYDEAEETFLYVSSYRLINDSPSDDHGFLLFVMRPGEEPKLAHIFDKDEEPFAASLSQEVEQTILKALVG